MRLSQMNNISENNWSETCEEDGTFIIRKCHESLPLDWVKYNSGHFGIGVRVLKEKKLSVSASHKFIKSELINIGTDYEYLTFYCVNPAYAPIFNQLCLDLIRFCDENKQGQNIGQAIISRAKAWEMLFNKGPQGLGKKNTKGLFAELEMLEHYWLKNGFELTEWVGPEGAEVDFVSELISVEAKVRSTNYTVHVSSLHQLQVSNNTVLFSCIVNDSSNGESLDNRVERLYQLFDDSQKEIYINKIISTGFIKNHNYSEPLICIDAEFHLVDNEFPHIEPDQIEAVVSAKYELDLSFAETSKITEDEFYANLRN
ncbi:MAG: hypothetical protein ACI9O6_003493 [Glaciecola sp.]